MGVFMYPELRNLFTELDDESRHELNEITNGIFQAGRKDDRDKLYFYVVELLKWKFPFAEYSVATIIAFLFTMNNAAIKKDRNIFEDFIKTVNENKEE